ncbi:MAG: flagellar motor protein MotB [Gammaproteobacteria bacterium]
MAKDQKAPVIIVKKHGKHKHAHHGGSWKVAFADFVTAMMAFFLLMWLLSSASELEIQEIEGYFKNPEKYNALSSAGSSFVILQSDTAMSTKLSLDSNSDGQVGLELTEDQLEKILLEELKEKIEKNLEESQAMHEFKDQVVMDVTEEGLRIQVVDSLSQAMFAPGSPNLNETTTEVLKALAAFINTLPNKISITGHTDAKPFVSENNKQTSNWELSAERANAARRALVSGGLEQGKVARIVGSADQVLYNDANPEDPSNRRISIIVLNKEAENSLFKKDKKLEEPAIEVKTDANQEQNIPKYQQK